MSANPLDWPGPQFLLLYWVLLMFSVLVATASRKASEGGDPPKVDTSDPYLIASLRGGVDEVLRIALFNLEDRGLLKWDGDHIVSTHPSNVALVRRPLERAVLRHFEISQPADSLFDSLEAKRSAAALEEELKRKELLPSPRLQTGRLGRFFLVGGATTALGVAKAAVALGRGRTNLGFLLISMLLAGIILWVVSFPRRTARGDRLLEDLRELFARLKYRASSLTPGGASNEAALLVAVYGLGALPMAQFPTAHRAERAGRPSSGDDSGGSSDGGSSSSSGGSSCGGGCGGGCGGCGS